MSTPTRDELVAEAARQIHDGFDRYNRQFRRITDRARRRFEERDWEGQFADIAARVELYEYWAGRTEKAIRKWLGERVDDHGLWPDIRAYYGSRVEAVPDAGFMKTFFNSITRRIFGTIGVDRQVEFVQPPPEEGITSLTMRRYPCWGELEDSCARVLKNFGVTNSGRVVFYDYDEVSLVTDCWFRELPEPDEDFSLMEPGSMQYVGPNDIFPEEFIRFLSMPRELRANFLEAHGDLLSAEYWRDVKRRRERGEIAEIVPYARQSVSREPIPL